MCKIIDDVEVGYVIMCVVMNEIIRMDYVGIVRLWNLLK